MTQELKGAAAERRHKEMHENLKKVSLSDRRPTPHPLSLSDWRSLSE